MKAIGIKEMIRRVGGIMQSQNELDERATLFNFTDSGINAALTYDRTRPYRPFVIGINKGLIRAEVGLDCCRVRSRDIQSDTPLSYAKRKKIAVEFEAVRQHIFDLIYGEKG